MIIEHDSVGDRVSGPGPLLTAHLESQNLAWLQQVDCAAGLCTVGSCQSRSYYGYQGDLVAALFGNAI